MLGRFCEIPLLLAVCCVTSNACGGNVPLGGTLDVTRSERVWVDSTRRTPPNGTFPGAPMRTLRTLIWQPAAADAMPVVVMAHGFGVLPEDFAAFAASVAAAGFIVAAPEFPLTNRNPPGGRLGVNDLNNQPGDLSFVITQLLQATSTTSDPLHGRILADDVAAIGQSLGGATVIGLTRKNCCRDVRVRASVLSAAPLLPFFGSDPLSAAGPPTLILHGTADTTVGFATATQLYSLIAPPRFLVGLKGAEHADALESQVEPPIPARDAGQRATVAFLNAVFRSAAAELDTTLAALAAQGNDVHADPGGWPLGAGSFAVGTKRISPRSVHELRSPEDNENGRDCGALGSPSLPRDCRFSPRQPLDTAPEKTGPTRGERISGTSFADGEPFTPSSGPSLGPRIEGRMCLSTVPGKEGNFRRSHRGAEG